MAAAFGTYTPQVDSLSAIPRRIMPEAPNTSSAQGLEGLGEGISDVSNAVYAKERADASTQANNILTDLRIKTQSDFENAKNNAADGAANFTPNLLNQFDSYTSQLQGTVAKNPLVSRAVQAGIQQIRGELGTKAITWQAAEGVNYRATSIQNNTTKLSDVVQNDPTQIKAVGDQQMYAINNSQLPPEVRLNLAKDMNDKFTMAATQGMIQKEPESVVDQIDNPDHAGAVIKGLDPAQQAQAKQMAYTQIAKNQANSVVNTYATQGPLAGGKAYAAISNLDLPDDVKNEIIKTTQAGLGDLQAQRRQQYAPQLIGLESRLSSGQPAAGDRQLAWQMYGKQAISQEQLAANLGRMDALALKNEQDAARIQMVTQAYHNGIPLDPKTDAKDVNDFFLSMAKTIPPGSPAWQNLSTDIAAKTGVIPSTAVDGARADLVSGNPQSAVDAAKLVSKLQDASPRGAEWGLDEKTKAMAFEINNMVTAGTPAANAVQIARDNASKDTKPLEQKWKQLKPEQNSPSQLRSLLEGDKEFDNGTILNGTPDPPLGMVTEFNNLTKQYFDYTNGDLGKARQLAANDLKNTWGVTTVNGTRELMKYAPSTRIPGLTDQMVRDDIAKSVPRGTDASKVHLAPLPGTGGTEETHGMSWMLMQPDKFGAYEPITNPDGTPMTYTLPSAIEGYRAQQAKAISAAHQKGLLEQARQRDKDRISIMLYGHPGAYGTQ